MRNPNKKNFLNNNIDNNNKKIKKVSVQKGPLSFGTGRALIISVGETRTESKQTMVQLLAALPNKKVWTRGGHAVIQGLFCLFRPFTLGTKIS